MEQQKTDKSKREAYSTPGYRQFHFETSGLAQMSGIRITDGGGGASWGRDLRNDNNSYNDDAD